MTLVVDASALLALLRDEPGGDRVAALLDDHEAVVGAVNACEVSGKLAEHGMDDASIRSTWAALNLVVVPLDAGQAHSAAMLRPATRSLGLSIGDRCCLALARHTPDSTVVTADRAWKSVRGFRFEFVR